ncbi:MAG: septation protein A [Hyphomicrobium sp.]|nr:septation protein A [Hyphomicrobium sp.]
MDMKKKRFFPFNVEQTVNILSEFGPLIAMFVTNAIYSESDPTLRHGTIAIISTTILAIIVMKLVLKRFPIFPLIASGVTIAFGTLALVTDNPTWVIIKVTIFNALFAAFLLFGLWTKRNFFKYAFEKTFYYTEKGWNQFTLSFAMFFLLTAVANEYVRLTFNGTEMYNVFGQQMSGINIWVFFKIAIVLPVTGVYAWVMTRLMQKHRLPPAAE